MELQFIGLIAFAVGLTAFQSPMFAFCAFIVSTLLGSSAAIILTFMGGANIQPAHLMLGFLTLGFLTQSSRSRSFEVPREAWWLAAAVGYGVFGAFFLPRLFAGETYVNAIGVTEFGFATRPIPLGPTSGNITQSVYFIGNLVCFIVSYTYARSYRNFHIAARALLAYCILNIVFAFLDLGTYLTGTGFLLDFIRNSTYQLHLDTEIDGLKRIVGSFTETSAFSYASIAALGYSARLWLGGVAPAITLPVAIVSMALLVFSTSSTAYVALPVILCFLLMTSTGRVLNKQANGTTLMFVIMTPLVGVLGLAVILLTPSVSSVLFNFIDMMVLKKATTASGIERTAWNVFAIQNFIDTYGLGAGIGSVRASSFIIAVMSNLGVIGGLAYFVFIYQVLTTRVRVRESREATIQAAAQTGCVGMLLTSTISGALIDLGLLFFTMAGIAVAATRATALTPAAVKQRRRVRPNDLQPGLTPATGG
ncbi:MAG: hypothetical protein JWL93_703 [Hyphomicrobiales bacterium]|nr:hypothetical protein [Hyphomicrobiales bacterium]